MKNIIPRINKRPENKKENNDDNIQIINYIDANLISPNVYYCRIIARIHF